MKEKCKRKKVLLLSIFAFVFALFIIDVNCDKSYASEKIPIAIEYKSSYPMISFEHIGDIYNSFKCTPVRTGDKITVHYSDNTSEEYQYKFYKPGEGDYDLGIGHPLRYRSFQNNHGNSLGYSVEFEWDEAQNEANKFKVGEVHSAHAFLSFEGWNNKGRFVKKIKSQNSFNIRIVNDPLEHEVNGIIYRYYYETINEVYSALNSFYETYDYSGVAINNPVQVKSCVPSKIGSNIFIPNDVKMRNGKTSKVCGIYGNAFSSCRNVNSVTIGSNVKEISKNAFLNTGIKYAVLPNDLNYIGDHAFGFTADVDNKGQFSNYSVTPGFTIYAKRGTKGFQYASLYGFNWSDKIPNTNKKLLQEKLQPPVTGTSIIKRKTPFYIAKSKILKVKRGKNRVILTFKKIKNADGYRVAVKRSGKKGWKYYHSKSTKKTIKNLKKGKKYIFKVRAYVKIGGKYYYGKYSTSKSIKSK